MRPISLVLALSLGLFAPCLADDGSLDHAAPFLAPNFRTHVAALASDDLNGRALGSEGAEQAAAYIADQFAALQLVPLGDDGTFIQSFRVDDRLPARNVLGKVPGRGDLASHCVIVSAHYDHLGVVSDDQAEDVIFNGADDNASGISAMLLIAEALIRDREALPPSHRTVVFAAFDAEEAGLLGARHYTEDPPIPLAATSTVLNFDMVGRLRGGKLYAGDAPTSPLFPEWLGELAPRFGLAIEDRFGGVNRSDQAPFLEEGIPGIHFNTGIHPEYHHVTDEVETVDHDGGRGFPGSDTRCSAALWSTPARCLTRSSIRFTTSIMP